MKKTEDLDIEKLYSTLRKFIFKADYESAVKYLKKIRLQYPENFHIETNLATLPYENAFYLPERQRNIAFCKAANNLKPYLRKMHGIPQKFRIRTRNEYYWFSQQHKKQYNLGVKLVKSGNLRSYYSQGVGAANYAYKLSLKGQIKRSLRWAKIAEKAWELYFEKVNKEYFDPWTWYALSLGIQGHKNDMEQALKTAAKLAKISYKRDSNLNQIRAMIAKTDIQIKKIKN